MISFSKAFFVFSIAAFVVGLAGKQAMASMQNSEAPALSSATAYFNTTSKSLYLVPNVVDEAGVGWASFEDGLNSNGWGILKVQTNETFEDVLQAKAAGLLEGSLTASRIHENYLNIWPLFFTPSTPSSQIDLFKTWFSEQDKWTREEIERGVHQGDAFWMQVGLVLAQFDGLYEGYKLAMANDPSKALDVFDLQVLNGNGDLLDLASALIPSRRPNFANMTDKEIRRKVALSGRCSGLIKVTGALEDVFAAHSSWFEYAAMNRIYKHYNLNIKHASTSMRKVSFSSYPGYLSSLDDFYLMDSGLVMIQTTNNIFNQSLYDLIHPQTLLAWQRVRVANTMARDGEQWADFVSRHNSGTYNNQYMVLDLNKVHLQQSIDDNALWVVEQIPGLMESADVTPILRTGYWASYNVPYFERIYNLSGYPDFVAKHGPDYSHILAPRAKIFRRDANNVFTFDELKHIMRYNDYKNDPYSEGDPANAICSRIDLEPDHPDAGGCYDTKVTNYARARLLQSEAINGPTAQGLPPFSWDAFPDVSHAGQPNVFNFTFIPMDPKW